MASDSALDRAEQNLKEQEAGGISYPTPEGRGNAKVQMAEAFELEQRQETSVTSASSASEGGNVVGVEGSRSLEAIDEQLARLRKGPRTSESMKAMQKLNEQKKLVASVQPGSVEELAILLGR